MKPLKLSMTAFGPYKYKETIDFEQLNDHHLFVISGATGAGKTTIFDALCFALYGTASGTDRENMSMLRSHFADDDTHTSVELIFELNRKKYRVFRQLGHVKEGNKTRTGERYEFFELLDDKTEVPCVERQIVSEINEKLEAIIGLTQDQFKQIVMLPQGEFRKLLTSETENKEAILRRLFKTERYKQMNATLKEKKEEVNKLFLQEQQLMEYYIQNINSMLEERENSTLFNVLANEHYNIEQIMDGLDEEMLYLKDKIKKDEKQYTQAVKQYEQKQSDLHKAMSMNERFTLLDQKNVEFTALQNQKELFLQKEQQVEAAERASRIEPYENQVIERRKEQLEKEQFVKAATNKLEEAKKRLATVQQAYIEGEKKEERREKLKRTLENYYDFLPTIKEMNQTRQQLQRLQENIENTSKTAKTLTQFLETKEKESEKLKTDINEKEKQVNERGKMQEEMYQLRIEYKVLEAYNKLRKKHYLLQKEFEEKEKIYSLAEKRYKHYESIWFQNQAAVLASQIEEGDACPVCGNTHHPQKAFNDHEEITKEELDEVKADLDTKQKAYQSVLADYRSYTAQLKEKAQEVSEYQVALEHVKQKIAAIVERGKKLKNEVERLDRITEQINACKKKLNQVEIDVKQAREKKEQIEEQLVKNRTNFTQLDATLKERLRNIPEEIQNLTTLQHKIKEMESVKDKLEKEWQEVQKQLQIADKEHTTAQVNVVHGNNQLKDVRSIVEKIEERFQQQLREAQFEHEEIYRQAKMSDQKRQSLQKELDVYKQQIVTLQKQIEELKEELKEKERVDLKVMEEQLQQLKQAYEAALEQLNQSQKYAENALSLKENILKIRTQSEALEKELAVVTDLYDVLRGDNMRKISFERYLQIDYLDQITQAANERFKTLTNGQFYLIRSDRQEAYGRQSGLAIDVYDAYTGQTRDVKTLSGGEKFIASLCLALGMSDVIQSFQGSISMDTMFIDEGFGSLDEESLHKSIDALISLQQTGRMIGVISHVEELKTIFPAMLEVNKTKEGYSKTKFVLK